MLCGCHDLTRPPLIMGSFDPHFKPRGARAMETYLIPLTQDPSLPRNETDRFFTGTPLCTISEMLPSGKPFTGSSFPSSTHTSRYQGSRIMAPINRIRP